MQTLRKVKAIQFLHPKLVQSCARMPQGKNDWENKEKQLKTAKNCAEKTAKQRKHLSLAKQVLKSRRILSKNRRPEISSKKGRFSVRSRGLESPQFILRTILAIAFHQLHQQHSAKLSTWSSETKSHQHLNIKVFALNPCPKLINKTGSTIPVNTCDHSNMPKCTHKTLWEWLPPSWFERIPY